MKILLVAATRAEVEPLLNPLQRIRPEIAVEVLITGVGMVATAFALGKQLSLNQYDLAINVGIAGSFDFNLPLGEVVLITEDIFSEQGAEDGESFLPLQELGFGGTEFYGTSLNELTASDFGLLTNSLQKLKTVKAITVNKVHGHELSIEKTLSRFTAQVESMEGAAFFYACKQTKTPCLQIRAISNYVERRNKEKWNIGLAVKNLHKFVADLFDLPKTSNLL